jgi:hypothetical protein
VAEKRGSGSLKISGGRIPSRIVSVTTVKGEFLAPVVKGANGVEGNSLVTLSSLAVKSASETIEEVVSVSEGEASLSGSSCCSTPMASRTKRSRQPFIRAALKSQRSIKKAELNREDCVLVKPSQREEMLSLMHGDYQEMKAAVSRFHLISKRDPKIRELAVSAANKSDSV